MYTSFEIYTAVNHIAHEIKAKSLAPDKALDRLNKAIDIVQDPDYYQGEKEEYHPTLQGCGCKDWEFRFTNKRGYKGACKHMQAEYMVFMIEKARREAAVEVEFVLVMER